MDFDIIRITEEHDAELELYFSANETQLLHYYEPELGLFVVESPVVIERALAADYEVRSFVMIDSLAEEMCERFRSIIDRTSNVYEKQDEETAVKIPVYVADYETIADMTGVNITRGVLALMKRRELPDLEELVKDYRRIAIFDDVENPTNVGAMFRSAAALGIDAVVLAGASSDPLYRRASRVSVGTVFQLPWTKLNKKNKSLDYVQTLHQLGFKTVAMALNDNSIQIDDNRLKSEEKLAIILGNEGVGLSDDVISKSDYVAKIPMKNNVDSLNVAAASSIIFWELR